MKKNFKIVAVSIEAFGFLQREKKRTGLNIYTIVDAALVHLVALNKGQKHGTSKVVTDSLK